MINQSDPPLHNIFSTTFYSHLCRTALSLRQQRRRLVGAAAMVDHCCWGVVVQEGREGGGGGNKSSPEQLHTLYNP